MKRTGGNHASGFKIKPAIATIKKPLPGGFTQCNPFRHRLAKCSFVSNQIQAGVNITMTQEI